MNYLFRELPPITLMIALLNEYFNLDNLLITFCVALLIVGAYAAWSLLRNYKQIRLSIRPARRLHFWEWVLMGVVTVVTLVFWFFINKEPAPEFRKVDTIVRLFACVCICANSVVMIFIGFNNRLGKYLNAHVFLESGFKRDFMHKTYPWNHFTAFEVLPQEQAIVLEFRNGEKLPLKIHKKVFDDQLPAMEIFLRSKIVSMSI